MTKIINVVTCEECIRCRTVGETIPCHYCDIWGAITNPSGFCHYGETLSKNQNKIKFEIIRCKDCKYYNQEAYYCEKHNKEFGLIDFCNYGETICNSETIK